MQFAQQQEAQVPYDTVQDGYVQQESYGGVRGNAPAGAAVNRAPNQNELIQMEDGTIYSPRNLMSGLQDLLSHLVRENTELRARNASQAILIQRDAERYDALQAKYAELSRHNLHVSRKHEEQAKTIEKMTQEQARLRERNGEEVRLLPIRVNREAKVYITVEDA